MLEKLSSISALAWENLLQNLPGLGGLLLTLVVFMLAGAAVSRERIPVLLGVQGWALSLLLAIALPLIGVHSLKAMLLGMGVLLVVGALRLRRTGLETHGLLPSIVLGTPLVLISACVPASFWDGYLHWLPNARYLVEFDHLLTAPLPANFYSFHPTYAPGLAIPIYVASQVTGSFAIGAAQTFATVLLVLSAQPLLLLIPARGSQASSSFQSWLLALVALAALVLVNPAIHDFAARPWRDGLNYWAPLADLPLALLLLLALAVMARQATDPARPEIRHDRQILFSLAFVMTLLKASGIELVLLLPIALTMTTLFAKLPLRRPLVAAAWLVLGAGIATGLWRGYLATHLPIPNPRTVLPLAQWRFDLLGEFLASFLISIRVHWATYLLGAVGVALGVRALLRRLGGTLGVGEVLLVCSCLVLLGHLLWLVVAYMSTGFGDWEIRGAFSLQRYVVHAALASSVSVLLVLGLRFMARPRVEARLARSPHLRGGHVALFLVVLAVAYLPVLRAATGAMSYYSEDRDERRRLATVAVRHIPLGSSAAVVGETWSGLFARYSAWADFDAAERRTILHLAGLDKHRDLAGATATLDEWLEDPAVQCILLNNAMDLTAHLGLEPAPDYLWCRDGRGWRRLDLGRQQVHHLVD